MTKRIGVSPIKYLCETQGMTKSRAYYHWSQMPPARRAEVKAEAKRYVVGSQKRYKPRADFTGVPRQMGSLDDPMRRTIAPKAQP